MSKLKNKHIMIIFLSGIMLSLFSCSYSVDPREADYPDQRIYMPAAYGGGQFVINDIARVRGELPIEGMLYRYVIDMANREFRVPLSVYRSGVDNNGSFTVDINVNTDIIATINENREEDNKMLLIPSDQYSIVNSVEMQNGKSTALFDLIVNLDFLRDNYPDQVYAIGVEISSSQREINPTLNATAVIIHTSMIKPAAVFTYSNNDSRKIDFKNASLMSTDYQWDFGDGTAISTEESPSHVYSAAGTYTVTLTAVGITGEEDLSEMTVEIVIP